MLKKAASGILAMLPDLRAHRLAALRGVRAHILDVRSARQTGCGLARGKGRLGALGFGRVTKLTFLNIPKIRISKNWYLFGDVIGQGFELIEEKGLLIRNFHGNTSWEMKEGMGLWEQVEVPWRNMR